MFKRVMLVPVAAAVLLVSDRWEPPIHSAEIATTLFGGSSEFCLMPSDRNLNRQTRGGGAGRETKGDVRRDPGDWPPENVKGGDVMPLRTVFDPYPTFDAVAVDPESGRAFFTDSSLSSLISYATAAGGNSPRHHRARDARARSRQRHRIHRRRRGRSEEQGSLRRQQRRRRRGRVLVRPDGRRRARYGSSRRRTSRGASRSADGATRSPSLPSSCTASCSTSATVKDMEPPLRSLRGYATGLADPHGIDYDDQRKELVIANHGNWTELRPYSPYDPLSKDPPSYEPGPLRAAVDPSVFRGGRRQRQAAAQHHRWQDRPQLADGRRRSMKRATRSSWRTTATTPCVFYRATADGDAEPVRIIKGDRTGLVGPVDVSVDIAAQRDSGWPITRITRRSSSSGTRAATSRRSGSSATGRRAAPSARLHERVGRGVRLQARRAHRP